MTVSELLPYATQLLTAGVTIGIVVAQVSSLRKDFDKWENRVFNYLTKEK